MLSRYRAVASNDLESFASYARKAVLLRLMRRLKHAVAARFSLHEYCERMYGAKGDTLLVPGQEDIHLGIDDCYVPLVLQAAPGARLSVDHLLSPDLRSALVVGDPGSGKSSLAKVLFRQLCRDGVLEPSRARLPILIELRELTDLLQEADDRAGNLFTGVMESEVLSSKVYEPLKMLRSYLEASGVVLILDGLDEVPTCHLDIANPSSQRLYPHIVDAIKTHDSCLYRQDAAAYSSAERAPGGIRWDLSCSAVLKDDVLELLRRWPAGVLKEQDGLTGQVFRRLSENPSLADMCTNPLVLAMLVAHEERSAAAKLPDTRTAFYRLVTDELLFYRRTALGSHEPDGALPSRRQRSQIVGAICLSNLLDGDQPPNLIDLNLCVRITARILDCEEAEALTTLRAMEVATGVFAEERRNESVRFIHGSFCEFFAASEVADLGAPGWNNLLSKCNVEQGDTSAESEGFLERLSEVIVFCAGLLSRSHVNNYLLGVSRMPDLRLALACVNESQAYELDVAGRMIDRAYSWLTTRIDDVTQSPGSRAI